VTADLVIRNGWVISHDRRQFGGVAIKGEQIVYVGPMEGLPRASRTIDAEEQIVIPGLIDPHVHMASEEDPSISEGLKANLPVESKGMVHGGVTTFGHFVGAADAGLEPMLRETIEGLNNGSFADSIVHAFVMGKHHLDEIDAAWDLGVTSFKHFYTAYGRRKHEDAGLGALFAPVDNDVLLESMWRIAEKGSPGLAMVHAEDGDLVTAVSAKLSESGRSDLAAWSEGRPVIAEALRAHQAIHLAEWTRCPLYVVHVTTADACREIAGARARGVRVWGEAGPHWLTHHGGMEREIGCWGKVNPPLRTPEDADALWRGFHTGGITCLGTDHGTGGRTREMKEKGGGKHDNIWAARPGIRGGSEHMLAVLVTFGIDRGRIAWEDIVRCGSYNTARAMGLYPRKGGLWPGADADIVVVDPTVERTVDNSFYHGLCEVSVYEGQKLRSAPRVVTVRGRVTLEDYEVAVDAGWGRYLRRT
jgi:dihydroorotase-like cyclic amidohydrolase